MKHQEIVIPQGRSDSQDEIQKPVPIEVKWNIPEWLMRDPGPAVEIEDDDQASEKGVH